MDCMDDSKHAAFKAQKAEKQKKQADAAAKKLAQEQVQAKATWDLLGGKTSQL